MTKNDQIKIAFNVAIISALLVVVISIVMLLNYYQLTKSDPLNNEALKVLVERTFENPDDEALREDVRNLDLLTRKAYFTAKWQTRSGSYLLLFSGILLIISMRVYVANTKDIPVPEKNTRKDYLIGLLAQRWILAIGSLVLILAFVSGFLMKSSLPDYEINKEQALLEEEMMDEDESEIEVIEVRAIDSTSLSTDSMNQTANVQETDSAQVPDKVVKLSPYPTTSELKANFASFRGYLGNGLVSFKNIPTSWDGKSGKNILWKTEIPVHGYNSPVTWGDKLFLAGGNKKSRVVYCLDRNTGVILWEKEVKNVPGSSAKMPKTTDDTGLSAASVTTDGRKVFAIFANGDLIAFDLDGNELWSKNLGTPDNHYGHSSSLLTHKDKLFVQFDSNRGGKVYAINVNSGSITWQTIRKCKISWASPILADINGKKQLILASNPIVAGYDIQTGKELWSLDCMYGEVGPSPAYGSGLIFAANEYAKLVAIDPSDNYKVKWEDDEYLPEVSSPVVSEGLLYIATSYGALLCYDALTGDKLWEQEYKNGFYSSPIIVDGKLYALDMGGVMHIIKVTKDFKLIAEPKMNEKIVTTPVFADGKIYIRGDKFLYCIGK